MKTLRHARKMKKITQAELAARLSEKLGATVTQQQICNYEVNFSLPPLDKLVALEEVLDVNLMHEYRQLVKAGVRRIMRTKLKNGRKSSLPV